MTDGETARTTQAVRLVTGAVLFALFILALTGAVIFGLETMVGFGLSPVSDSPNGLGENTTNVVPPLVGLVICIAALFCISFVYGFLEGVKQ